MERIKEKQYEFVKDQDDPEYEDEREIKREAKYQRMIEEAEYFGRGRER